MDDKCKATCDAAMAMIDIIYQEAKRQENTVILDEGSYKEILRDMAGTINAKLELLK